MPEFDMRPGYQSISSVVPSACWRCEDGDDSYRTRPHRQNLAIPRAKLDLILAGIDVILGK